MKISFRQGIITYPVSGTSQDFLKKTGSYVSLNTNNGIVSVDFTHGDSDYLLTEVGSVTNAWGPIPTSTDAWLYWDIDTLTAVRTFGFTLIAPSSGSTKPSTPTTGQHFFDTSVNKMYVYQSGGWREVIRTFAAKVNDSTFTPLGSGFATRPYAGTQVGLFGIEIATGSIFVDSTGAPVIREDGRFFTSEDQFFINGSPVNAIRLEANVVNATANTNMAKFHVVKFSSFGRADLAGYNDLQTTIIAMLTEDLTTNQTGSFVTQGLIENPDWNWSTVGAELWVSENGELTESDPHLASPGTYTQGKPPVGRVFSPTSIFFDQGLGGKGDTGAPGPAASVPLATNSVFGTTKLSVAAVSASNPIAVGDNDPRNSDARTPLAHGHAATEITLTPYSTVTAADVQGGIQQLADQKVNRAGDTMSGFLTLNASPTNPLHAATKQYVDLFTLAQLNDVTLVSPHQDDVLYYNGGLWTNGSLTDLIASLAVYVCDLYDVDCTTPPTDRQFLMYDAGTSTWKAGNLSYNTPSLGDVLSWNGTQWEAVPPSTSGVALNDITDITIDATNLNDSAYPNAWLVYDQGTSQWVNTYGMPYDFHFFLPSTAAAIQDIIMGLAVLPRTVKLATNLVGSQAWCGTAATSAAVTFEIRKNDVAFASADFAIGSQTGTFTIITSDVYLDPGDRVTIVPIAPENAEIEDVAITLVGCTLAITCDSLSVPHP